MLKLTDVKKDYVSGELVVHALKGVSFEFRKSEFVSVLGPSGCGKTTLLNILGGLDRYTEGDLVINGVSTKNFSARDWDNFRNHSVGFIFQSYNLIMHQNVLANVELALTLSGVNKKERRERAKQALIRVGLEKEIKKMPNQLSGGQMQRVAIARAIVNNPDIILADEPTGALDTETSVQVLDILKEISADKLVIMVTHNPELAKRYSTRIITMEDGLKTSDSNPITEEERLVDKKAEKPETGGKKKKASMSFFTAFALSLKNLFTKKARTILTSVAGSIGIIGIALIMSVSSGFQGYIDDIQRDTLSSSPITISRQSLDFMGAITSFMGSDDDGANKYPKGDYFYSDNQMQKMVDKFMGSLKTVELDRFKQYLEENIDNDYIHGVKYSYSLPLVFAGYSGKMKSQEKEQTSKYRELFPYDVGRINKVVQAGRGDVDYWSTLLSLFNDMNPFSKTLIKFSNGKAVNNWDIVKKQYELIDGGRFPTDGAKDEMILVVDEYNRIPDSVLFSLGLRSEGFLLHSLFKNVIKSGMFDRALIYADSDYNNYIQEAINSGNLVDKGSYSTWLEFFTANPEMEDNFIKFVIGKITGYNYDLSLEDKPISFDEVKSTSYRIMPLVEKYKFNEEGVLEDLSEEDLDKKYDHKYDYNGKPDNVLNVKITGVVRLKEGLTSGCLDEGLAYQNELTEWLINANNQSEIVATLNSIYFDEGKTADEKSQILNEKFAIFANENGTVGYTEIVNGLKLRDLNRPQTISIYASDFDNKDYVVNFIKGYNKTHPDNEIEYNDYMGTLFSSVSKIVNAITYVLIAFVSISLIVSSIMIGIITYISVLERTKEIGILRSIGASKRNVGAVFNAEALIIGFAGGLIGIIVSIIINLPISALLKSLTGVAILVRLPWGGGIALLLISMLLTTVAGLIPSSIASKKDPVVALRSAG